MTHYYPPPGFHFRVDVQGLKPHESDMRFTEVSGLAMELLTEEIPEGGENRFVQKYPSRTKYPELVLKRGLLTNSEILVWIEECVGGLQITPRDINVILLNDDHEPLLTWHLTKAFPTKWATSDLNAMNNAVVIETIQFFYQTFTLNKAIKK
ncbi:MAG: phage tail protein [Myxococcales bacterium]|nr:phage tail protein [Myxococcales bacterium]